MCTGSGQWICSWRRLPVPGCAQGLHFSLDLPGLFTVSCVGPFSPRPPPAGVAPGHIRPGGRRRYRPAHRRPGPRSGRCGCAPRFSIRSRAVISLRSSWNSWKVRFSMTRYDSELWSSAQARSRSIRNLHRGQPGAVVADVFHAVRVVAVPALVNEPVFVGCGHCAKLQSLFWRCAAVGLPSHRRRCSLVVTAGPRPR